MEIWKDIPWYEWIYQASNLWNIKVLDRICQWVVRKWKVLKNNTTRKWYKRTFLYKNKKRKAYLTHRLIALTFIWDSNWMEVNHKNWLKTDNNILNIEYCTRSENVLHAIHTLKTHNLAKRIYK